MSEHHTGQASAATDSLAARAPRATRAGSSAREAKAVEGLSVQIALRAFRHWWKVAIPVGVVLAVAGGAAVWATFEPSYRATATLQVKERQGYVLNRLDQDTSRFIQNQIETIRHALTLQTVVSKPEIGQLPELKETATPVEWLRRVLSVRPVGGSEYLEVSLAGPVARNAKAIVNAIVETYVQKQNALTRDEQEIIVKQLERQKEVVKQEVEKQRTSVRMLGSEVAGEDPRLAGGRREAIVSNPLKDRFDNTRVDRQVLEVEIEARQAAYAASPIEVPALVVEREVESRTEVRKLKDAAEVKLTRLREAEQSGVSAGAIKRLKDEIDQNNQRLEELRGTLQKQIVKDLEQAATVQRQEALQEMKAQVGLMKTTEEKLEARIDQQTQGNVQTGNRVMELDFAKALLAQKEQLCQKMEDRILSYTIERDAPAQVKIFQVATEPLAPEERAPYKLMSVVALFGFGLPFALAVAWEYQVRRISDSRQISTDVSLPVVGEIAALPLRRFGSRRNGRSVSRQRGVFEESIDSLRTTLILSEQCKVMRTLAVVSAVSREGKTSLAAQLVVSLARASADPVLIIDADMRSPDLHEIFEVPLEPGLSALLDKRCTLADAIMPTTNPLVHVLPAGRLHRNPHSLVGNGALRALLDAVRPRYRYVVIDTPPILSASESLVLAKAADGVLLCTMREISRSPQVQMTYERLLAAGAHPVGVVLSGVPSNYYAYKYGAYSYAYSNS